MSDTSPGQTSITRDLAIEGMTCASCVARVERALQNVPGVRSAAVNLATERARVETDAGLTVGSLIQSVEETGYGATVVDRARPREDGSERRDAEARALRRDVAVAALLTAPVVALEMGGHLIPAVHTWTMATLGMHGSWWLQAALTTLVLAGPGRHFFRKGVPALLRRAPDMNSLVAVGSLAAYGYSLAATAAPWLFPASTAAVYFEAAAVIVTLVLAGR